MFTTFVEDIASFGLNLVGIAAPGRYDALVPAARRTTALHTSTRSIIVVASAGARFWEAFLDATSRAPELLTDEPHPLDAFARRAIERADVVFGTTPRRWSFTAATAEVHLDFRLLSEQAGLGSRSRLGLLLNRTYGTWLGLRAACFIDLDLAPSHRTDADPCEGCPGHCAMACPGDAFPSGTWDVDRCSAFHTENSPCMSTCHARVACPIGADFAYSELERLYHYDRFRGRRLVREHLGIPADQDRYEGEGPLWNIWRKRVDVKG